MRISMISFTPAWPQASTSVGRIGREELAMSIVLGPTPAQKVLRPAEEPPDSTIGDLNWRKVLPNCSATTLAKGSTVEEPATCTWSRANAGPAIATAASAATASEDFFMGLPCVRVVGRLERRPPGRRAPNLVLPCDTYAAEQLQFDDKCHQPVDKKR